MRIIELMCLFDNWNKFLVISDELDRKEFSDVTEEQRETGTEGKAQACFAALQIHQKDHIHQKERKRQR